MQRIKASAELLFDAVEQITNLVERTHGSVATKAFRSVATVTPTAPVTKTVRTLHDTTAEGVYGAIRRINRGVEKLLDIGFEWQRSGLSDASGDEPLAIDHRGSLAQLSGGSRLADRAESLLNAFYGDYLNRRQNSLDIGMSFRQDGEPLPMEREVLNQKIKEPTAKIVIFVHGLACTEWEWNIAAEEFHGDPLINFGSLLKNDAGYTPLYIRYNTGRHTSENGKLFSALLAQLTAEYPGRIDEIVLVGHSMGGLVARSAAHYGASDNAPWVQQLRHIFCLGSPNLGAPLEKGVNFLTNLLEAFDTAGTRVPAEILNARSAGIKDMRFGYTLDDEWTGKNPDAFLEDNRCDASLVDGVGYHYVAAIVTQDPEHPLGALVGDLFVRTPSAKGHAADDTRQIPFRTGQVFSGMRHMQIANHPDVYGVISGLL